MKPVVCIKRGFQAFILTSCIFFTSQAMAEDVCSGVTDSQGNCWSISDGQVVEETDGQSHLAGYSANVICLTINENGQACQENASHNWWCWNGGWVSDAAPASASSCPGGNPDNLVSNATTTKLSALHVSGNKLLNSSGKEVHLQGVDKMGTEYMCPGGNQVFDGPADAATVKTMLSWGINAVRLPMNEDCWLNINGVVTGGSKYKDPIIDFVNLLNENNIYVILDLHWNAGGTTQAKGQTGMADEDHAPAFWKSVATAFKGNNRVIFDLYNEPFITSWDCWLNGGCQTNGFTVAGMQSLVKTVRATGATNVIMIGGLDYANNLTEWVSHEPKDTLNPPQIAASWHSYSNGGAGSAAGWEANIANTNKKVPVIAGEFGEYDCGDSYVNSLMPFLVKEDISYLSWTWNTANCNGPALLSNYDGATTGFGAGIKSFYLKHKPD